MFGIIETHTFYNKVHGEYVKSHSTQRCIVSNESELPQDSWLSKTHRVKYMVEAYTPEQIALIIAAQQKQLTKPARAVVSPEGSFVASEIRKSDYDLSQIYWSFVCGFDGKADKYYNTKFGKEVFDNQVKLSAIDKSVTMPDWGYSGT